MNFNEILSQNINLLYYKKHSDIDIKKINSTAKIIVEEQIDYDNLLNEIKNFNFDSSENGISTKITNSYILDKIINNDDEKKIFSTNKNYIFHNILNDYKIKKIIVKYINLPKNFNSINELRISRFYTGYENSGTYLHSHSPALNYLISGKKL